MRRSTVAGAARSAVAALRKLKVRATTTSARKSSHGMRSTSAMPMGCFVFALARCEEFATDPRTPWLCYFTEAEFDRKSCFIHMIPELNVSPARKCVATEQAEPGE